MSMGFAEVVTVLKSTGIPVSNSAFAERSGYPQMVVYRSGHEHIYTENRNFADVVAYTAELYTTVASPATERTVEQALSGAGITYKKSGDTHNADEKWHRVEYTFKCVETI